MESGRSVAPTAIEADMETDPGGVMERQLVETYLRTQGHTLRSARDLPEALRRSLLAAAARYASLQMTEGDTEYRISTPVINAGTPDLASPGGQPGRLRLSE